MNTDDLFKNPWTWVPLGIAIAAVVYAVFAGLALVLPALAVAWDIASTGAAAGVTIAPAVGAAAGYGVAVIGAALAIRVTVQVTEAAKKKPFSWLLPLLSALAGFLVLLCKEYWSGNKLIWFIMAGISAGLAVAGGVLFGLKSWYLKGIAILLYLAIPGTVVLAMATASQSSLLEAIRAIPAQLWLVLGALCAVLVALVLLAVLAERKEL